MHIEKIMIVDDNEVFVDELREILDSSGYLPIPVLDSRQALKTALKTKPDIVLLDMKMKGLNGFQVAQQLKVHPETSRIPIIAMSGYYPIEKQSVLLDLSNMQDCLQKSFAVSDLIGKIEAALPM